MAKRSDQVPVSKIPRLSGTKKLAILSYSTADVRGFQLYVVNLDLNSIYARGGSSRRKSKYLHIKPRIQYSGKHDWVGCVLNSTLYIFQECRSKFSYIYEHEGVVSDLSFEGMPPPEQSAMKFVFSPEFLDSGREIQGGIDAFEELPPMKWPKSWPIAVPTPDGKKILVFQQYIDRHYEKTCFELYDAEVNAWSEEFELECPKLPPRAAKENIIVEAYNFPDDSTFVVSTSFGQFVVRLKPQEEEKKKVDVIYHVNPFVNAVTIDDKFYISAGSAARHGSGDGEIRFELSSPPANLLQYPAGPEWLLEAAPYSISLLDVDKDEEYAVTLFSLPRRCRNIPHSSYLTIDVCHTDLVTLETTIVDTLRYVIPRVGVGGSIIWRLEMFII